MIRFFVTYDSEYRPPIEKDETPVSVMDRKMLRYVLGICLNASRTRQSESSCELQQTKISCKLRLGCFEHIMKRDKFRIRCQAMELLVEEIRSRRELKLTTKHVCTDMQGRKVKK